MNQRLQLPVTAIEAEFRRVMRTVGTAAVSAPTGSGKSTQIPQWLLTETPEDSRIIVLQPRRLAARMLAERVACELGEKPGERVGYVTRFEHVVSPRSRIVFVTEGILTRMLLSTGDMDRVSAVMFDEFHQRSINADLGLAMAAELRRKSRPDLKLIVTSATLDSARVCTYLDDCPSLVSEGKLHPVEISYIRRNGITDCCRLAADAVQELLQEGVQGDILVFMPGVSEIRRCGDEIRRRRWGSEMEILPLYGDMSPQAQRAVMEPAAKRKIIIATNIAETSLTIPGVRIVVDSGLVRLNRRDALRGVDVLETVPICADAAAQRAGRAGREAPGRCIRLWSAIEQDHKKPHTPPEIQRLDLADPLLSVHAAGFRDDRSFPWFEAPPEKNADAARALLYELELLDGAGALTERGRGVRAIPAHPRLALLLLEGALSGCRELACGFAALLSGRPMLNRASGGTLTELRGKERRNSRANDAPASDFTAQLQLLHQAEQFHFRQDECAAMGVNGAAAAEISRDMKFFLGLRLPAPLKNNQERSPECALAQTLLKCFPDKLARKLDQGSLNCELQGRKRAQLSPKSLVRNEKFFIAAEIREVEAAGRPSGQLELSLASGIREDWLWEFFGDSLTESDVTFWDNPRQQAMRRRTLECRGLVLEESVRNDPLPEEAERLLAEQLESNSMPLTGWDDACEAWIDKVRFLAGHFPELELPEFNEEERRLIRAEICRGENRYQAVRSKPALPYIQAFLTQEQRSAVSRLAPDTLPLPRGRKLRIEYHPGMPPKGRARIQELYDLKGPVTIANGRIPILLDILAPNYRTVQITDDLPRFWEVHYPAARSQLARRYPKHEWR